MFAYCSNSTNISFDGINTSNLVNTFEMFANSLFTTIDLSKFDFSSVVDMDGMFENSSVTTIYARNVADAAKLETVKPEGATIIVGTSTL